MKHLYLLVCLAVLGTLPSVGQTPFGNGMLNVKVLASNAVRIQYTEGDEAVSHPEWIYVKGEEVVTKDISVKIKRKQQLVEVRDKKGKVVFTATKHQLHHTIVAGQPTHEAMLSFMAGKYGEKPAAEKEYQFGLGQFQDGYTNVFGLTRRLTQVNTQISIPMLISSKGYGILWNNYGLTNFNPVDRSVQLVKQEATGSRETVQVTSTEGGKQEVRERNIYTATIDVEEDGEYTLLLDVGQKMARRHQLSIDGENIIDVANIWLPPTTSKIVSLKAGKHEIAAELTKGDRPMLYYGKVKKETTFSSPVAQAVDYTVFVGSADEIIASYRHLTGNAPLMPQWALGYIHCRERFHTQHELLTTAQRFRNERLPIDVIVQDWQYWGKAGWNSMTFDADNYPSPRQMTDSLHNMNMRLMLSVWSKIDRRTEVGQQMEKDGYYIPDTDWIDFFNPDAAHAYWQNVRSRLLPLGIDAWWQDATEPENDDLVGRRIMQGRYSGEWFRNSYPLLVNKTIYEGLRQDDPDRRPMILTRCAFPGIQRYGAAVWSGDVNDNWETFRKQISAGLGMQAAGIPWWTYDAGGFFRPSNQYTDPAYIERMLRWIETAVYLPLMRVHGYISNTEPWEYGAEAQAIIAKCLQERYRLLPYIYSYAAAVSFDGSTLMRPLIFDFPNDAEALRQEATYMFGKSLLINPVTAPQASSWETYLPVCKGGWYDYHTGKHYDGGQYVTTVVDKTYIPVFVKAGSIIPFGGERQYAAEFSDAPIEVRIYPGADAQFKLYEDAGDDNGYEKGVYRTTLMEWNEQRQHLTIHPSEGSYKKTLTEPPYKIVVMGEKP